MSECQTACLSARTGANPCVGYTFLWQDAAAAEKSCHLKAASGAINLNTREWDVGERHSGKIKQGKYHLYYSINQLFKTLHIFQMKAVRDVKIME